LVYGRSEKLEKKKVYVPRKCQASAGGEGKCQKGAYT